MATKFGVINETDEKIEESIVNVSHISIATRNGQTVRLHMKSGNTLNLNFESIVIAKKYMEIVSSEMISSKISTARTGRF